MLRQENWCGERMRFFTNDHKPKSNKYRRLYREEMNRVENNRLSQQVKADVRRDITPNKEKIKAGAKQGFHDIDQGRKRLYGAVGGSITIHKDSLQRLKRIGKKYG